MKKLIKRPFLYQLIWIISILAVLPSRTTGHVLDTSKTLALKEVIRISDENKPFYFRMPHNIQVGPAGFIFVEDQKQLLQFDSNGNFLRNYVKEGSGPGEVTEIHNYQLLDDQVIVYGSPPKILRFDYQGNVQEELPLRSYGYLSEFEYFYQGRYYFRKTDWSKLAGNETIVEIPYQLVSISPESNDLEYHTSFPIRYFFAQHSGERAIIQIDRYASTPLNSRYLAVSHTPEYQISIFDAEKNRVILKLSREYKRIKAKKGEERAQPKIMLGDKEYTKPPQEYADDIMGLAASDDKLWVLTSSSNNEMGLSVDVFDMNGDFLENLILDFSGTIPDMRFDRIQLCIKDNYVYSIITGQNDIPNIIQYRMIR